MSKWFPKVYDFAMIPLERTRFKTIRKELIGKAEGRVLEIGSGTGINFQYYKNVTHVDAIEPDPYMINKSTQRKKHANTFIQSYRIKAEKLPFPDNTFDSVVATLVFCTINEPIKALEEIKRVSKPNARFLVFEHVRMEQREMLGKLQDYLTPYWKKICYGCHLNRNTLELIQQSGFVIDKIEPHYNGLFISIECKNSQELIS